VRASDILVKKKFEKARNNYHLAVFFSRHHSSSNEYNLNQNSQGKLLEEIKKNYLKNVHKTSLNK
jgi:hypothetical protein